MSVSQRDVIRVDITRRHMELAEEETAKLLRCREQVGVPAGGVSRIRDAEDRKKKLYRDAFLGQVSTLAMSLYWTGAVAEYLSGRERANITPEKGDGGKDIGNCDVKASILLPGKKISDYHLLVRPEEWHADVWYTRALIQEDKFNIVYLCGWLRASDVKQLSENITLDDPIFGDAYKVSIMKLHPLPPMDWGVGSIIKVAL